MDQNTYHMGATIITIPAGISFVTLINPASKQNGGFFKINSGAGTLAIVAAQGISCTLGYALGSNEVISFAGPAQFYLAAGSATMTVALCQSFSAGYSLFP